MADSSTFGDVSIPGGGSTSTDSTTNAAPQAPNSGAGSAVELNDDTLVRGVPGFNEPVRYGDLYKRLQSDYTRKTTEAQKLRQQYETEHQTRTREIQDERKRLEGIAATIAGRQGSQGPASADPVLAEIVNSKFLDGASAGKLVNLIQEKGFAPIISAFKERDQILTGMYNVIQTLQKQVNELSSAKQGVDFDGKINRWLSEGGYPQEAAQLAKELYLAYEGDDLDNEFPQIFETRWNQLQGILRAQDRKRVDEAKRLGRQIPGKGGSGSTGKPIGLKGHEKARDVASALWDHLQTGEET